MPKKLSNQPTKPAEKPKKQVRMTIKKPSMEQARRQRINQLYKRKRAIFTKAYRLAKICNQKVLVAIYDPRLRKFTQFSSDESFDIPHLVSAMNDPETKVKHTAASEIEKLLKNKKDRSDVSPDLSGLDDTSNITPDLTASLEMEEINKKVSPLPVAR